MGNVNARDDGGGSLSGAEEDGGSSVLEGMAIPGHEPVESAELMGHSPPPGPSAIQSPLMFTPQVPVVPLQRPDEIQIPSPSWMQTTSACEEDMSIEQGIPTMLTWSQGGKDVAVEGSWDNWRTRSPLQRSGKDYTIMKVLPSGVYQYRFIVDGQWCYSPDIPWANDDAGNPYNILDLQDYVPEDIGSISSFEPPQSPDSSYNNLLLGSEDFAKEPPLVPPHLQMTLLNVPTQCTDGSSALSRPQHVVLNHLYMQKGKGGQSVVALGSTDRFLAKYVTVVLYKSMQREESLEILFIYSCVEGFCAWGKWVISA